MAFTADTIEIRLIVNGNLVHTMTMPDLTLLSSKVKGLSGIFLYFFFNWNKNIIEEVGQQFAVLVKI